MYDIITFGSATQDIFLVLPKTKYRVLKTEKFIIGEGLCLPLGSKIDVKSLEIFSGGGGTNTAATFINQGFKTAFCGKTGRGLGGEMLIEDLKRFKIAPSLIIPSVNKEKEKESPAFSVVLSIGQRRTVLVARGACHFVKKSEIPWPKLSAKWFYLAPLSGETTFLFKPLVDFAKRNKIKVAANLGNSQINLSKNILNPILSKLDVLILNQEESSLLTKIPYQKENQILKKLKTITSAIIVITKEKSGSLVFDGNHKYLAGVIPVKIIEKTGAGDAFGSGFVSGLIKSKGAIEYAIQLGTANASFCLRKMGAKEGLLKKEEKWLKIKITRGRLTN